MDLLKKVFWTIFLVVIFIVAAKLGPIYYRAFSLHGICQESADIYHRYNKPYVQRKVNYELDRLGIPKAQREVLLTKTKDFIGVEIYYEDQANFFDYYKKDFYFTTECEGLLDSVLK